jgi:hypothetical protein
MAPKQQKDLLTRLAEAGEKALQQLGDAPGMDRVGAFATSTKDRLDELTKRVQGIGALEARIEKLEKQVAAMAKSGSSPKKSAAKRSSAKRSAS